MEALSALKTGGALAALSATCEGRLTLCCAGSVVCVNTEMSGKLKPPFRTPVGCVLDPVFIVYFLSLFSNKKNKKHLLLYSLVFNLTN